MADQTGIEWTDATWNPTTGCDRVSAGCDNCYALTLAKRLKAMGSPKYQTDGNPRTSGPGFGLAAHPDALTIPLGWRRPRRVFVNSMSDLFHARVPRLFAARVFAVMAATPQHTYQVLTKRPQRMARMLGDEQFRELVFVSTNLDTGDVHGDRWPLPNVWLGTSVEDQQRAEERIPALLDTPAAVRWLSCEPLLGPVNLLDVPDGECGAAGPAVTHHGYSRRTDYGTGVEYDCEHESGIDWVVVGGESGPGARPMDPDWARSLRDQCAAAGVPFLFKQWGESAPLDQLPPDAHASWEIRHGQGYPGATLCHVGKKAAGRELDGRTWDEYPVARSAEAVTRHG